MSAAFIVEAEKIEHNKSAKNVNLFLMAFRISPYFNVNWFPLLKFEWITVTDFLFLINLISFLPGGLQDLIQNFQKGNTNIKKKCKKIQICIIFAYELFEINDS